MFVEYPHRNLAPAIKEAGGINSFLHQEGLSPIMGALDTSGDFEERFMALLCEWWEQQSCVAYRLFTGESSYVCYLSRTLQLKKELDLKLAVLGLRHNREINAQLILQQMSATLSKMQGVLIH